MSEDNKKEDVLKIIEELAIDVDAGMKAALALMKLIKTIPSLIKVAENGYNKDDSEIMYIVGKSVHPVCRDCDNFDMWDEHSGYCTNLEIEDGVSIDFYCGEWINRE